MSLLDLPISELLSSDMILTGGKFIKAKISPRNINPGQNIPAEKFFEGLCINEPPTTRYVGNYVRTKFYSTTNEVLREQILCDAILNYGNCLMPVKHIQNPSENVVCAQIQACSWYFDEIQTPTKSMIMEYVISSGNDFEKYKHFFDTNDLKYILDRNCLLLKYILQTEELSWVALRANPGMIIHIQNQTIEMCEYCTEYDNFYKRHQPFVLFQKAKNDGGAFRNQIIPKLQHITPKVLMNIKNNPILLEYVYQLPEQYVDREFLIESLLKNPYNLRYITKDDPELYYIIFNKHPYVIQFIQKKFHTDEMKTRAINFNPHLIKYIEQTKELTDIAFNSDPNTLQYFNAEFHSEERSIIAVKLNRTLLGFCNIITPRVLEAVFKSQPNQPRISRFDFIDRYDEATLLKLVAVSGRLLNFIPEEKQTDALIRLALEETGYNIQYVKRKETAYRELALAKEPKAIKYLK